MSNIKYTSNGKKVAVIGKLNSQEFIVQEIFVNEDGSEIPSGEQFVTKSIHDKPVESWQVKEKARLEQAIASLKGERDALYEKVHQARLQHQKVVAPMLSSARKAAENIGASSVLDTLWDFIEGNITHVVIESYDGLEIAPIENGLAVMSDSYSYHGQAVPEDIKLISLFGKSNGDLEWRINKWYDGSGGWRTFVPVRSFEEARAAADSIIRDKVNKMGCTTGLVRAKEKYALSEPSAAAIRKMQEAHIQLNRKRREKVMHDLTKIDDAIAKDESELAREWEE